MKWVQYLLVIICVISCKSKATDINQIIQEWQGKEIILPEKIGYKILERDTICTELWDKSYKILTHIDSTRCVGCQLDLPGWKRLIDSCAIHHPSVSFLFIICSSDYDFLEDALIGYNFDYPIIYDRHSKFDQLNHFPPTPYNTLLLDKDNKVLLIGSPVNNPKMWDLYKNVISQ